VRALALALALAAAMAFPPPAEGQPAGAPGLHDVPDSATTIAEEPAPPPSAPDRRPLYVAGGVLVLGAIFLWNRRNRAELERESEDRVREHRTRTRAARGVQIDLADAPDAPDAPVTDGDDPDAAAFRAAAHASDPAAAPSPGEPKDQEPT